MGKEYIKITIFCSGVRNLCETDHKREARAENGNDNNNSEKDGESARNAFLAEEGHDVVRGISS